MNRLSAKVYGQALAIFFIILPSIVCNANDNLIFTGNFIAQPACTVSDNGGRIDVHFKSNIAISKVDGQAYRQSVPYQIECPGAAGSGFNYNMKLTLRGIPTQFDPAAIQTSMNGLGIRMLLNGESFILNQARQIEIDGGSSVPVLEAVPVKLPGAKLENGDFNASALLVAELY